MRLWDLTIYAKEKYHIAEQSGFTIVLASDLPAAQTEYHASTIPFSKPESSLQPATMPEKIRKIIKLPVRRQFVPPKMPEFLCAGKIHGGLRRRCSVERRISSIFYNLSRFERKAAPRLFYVEDEGLKRRLWTDRYISCVPVSLRTFKRHRRIFAWGHPS